MEEFEAEDSHYLTSTLKGFLRLCGKNKLEGGKDRGRVTNLEAF